MNITSNITPDIWTEKYRPHTLNDYYITKKQLDVVKLWMRNFVANNEDTRPFLILYGTAGIGKTTLAHLILNKYNYEVIECNASDFRSKKNIQEMLGQISTVTICTDNMEGEERSRCRTNTSMGDKDSLFKRTAIIMDEIDGLTGGESGGVQEILDLVVIKKIDPNNPKTVKLNYMCPVICTTNNIREKKLQPLIKLGIVLNINKPTQLECKKLIEKITTEEKFTIHENDVDFIINKSNGDFRQLIYNLYEFYLNIKINSNDINKASKSTLTDLSLDHYEDSKDYSQAIKLISNLGDSPLDKINHFLTNDIGLDDIRYICSGDSNLFYLNNYFNIIHVLSSIQSKKNNNKTKDQLISSLKELVNVYNIMCEGDEINNSIYTNKNWEALDQFDMSGTAIPIKLMSNINIKSKLPSGVYNCWMTKFNLQHHTPYNFMRQEQTANTKMIYNDYIKTKELDLTNIYYSMKTFELLNKNKMSMKQGTRKQMQLNMYNLDKNYLKIIEKMKFVLGKEI
jgi:replication factor C subunit 1